MQNLETDFIAKRIFEIRGERVMVDADLADLYGVPTKVLNQAVKRNRERFPRDFMLQLMLEEKNELVTNCDRFKNLKHSTSLPYAFTEHGAIMAANVLNSQRAIDVSIVVVRAFVKAKEILTHHKYLAKKLLELEQNVSRHDVHIRSLFNAIRQLIETPPSPPKRRIGF